MRKRKPKIPKTAREREVAAARTALGDDRVKAFVRKCREFEEEVIVCRLINKELARGASLDRIFYTGLDDGYYLDAAEVDAGAFEISLSWAARGAGGGGTWSVRFNTDGSIQQIEGKRGWIS